MPAASRSARRPLLHVIAETSQHAGHAEIIRVTLDGATTMGRGPPVYELQMMACGSVYASSP